MCRLTKQLNHDTIDTEVIQMKIGTIGTGFIVEWFLTAVEHNENCECLAVFSRKEETGRALADKFNVKKVYTDFEEMLKDEEICLLYTSSITKAFNNFLIAGRFLNGIQIFTLNIFKQRDFHHLLIIKFH